MCIACSVAELVSAYPTSGGLYYTVSRLAPREWVPSISWVTGWINLLGQVAGVASSEYGSAQLLLAAVSMGSNFTYLPTSNHIIGVMAALTVVCGLVNSLSTYWMEKMTKTYVIFHGLVLVTCAIALLAKTDNKLDANYVFTNVESNSGWTPLGFSFLFGFLSVSWTMTVSGCNLCLLLSTDSCRTMTQLPTSPKSKAHDYLMGQNTNLLVEFLNPKSRHHGPFLSPCYSRMSLAGSSTSFSASAWAILSISSASATTHLQHPSWNSQSLRSSIHPLAKVAVSSSQSAP